jgi:hypothetical protein
LAYQLAHIDVVVSTWPDIDPNIDLQLLVSDVWTKLVVALMKIKDELKVGHPLHLLTFSNLRKVRNKGDEVMWGDGDGYYEVGDDMSECECDDLEGGATCVIVKDIMHS